MIFIFIFCTIIAFIMLLQKEIEYSYEKSYENMKRAPTTNNITISDFPDYMLSPIEKDSGSSNHVDNLILSEQKRLGRS